MSRKPHLRRPKPMRPSISGVILVDKPLGWTSHDVISKLRGATGIKRIGHAGTLDPGATGVLVVMLGPATRLSQYLLAQEKTYIVTFSFGTVTDTDDADGTAIETHPVDPALFSLEFAEKTVASLIGVHSQIPPSYSSVKIDGVVAHIAARSGKDTNLIPRPIEIFDAHLIEVDSDNHTWTLQLKVSKGTYIRSIARDLGAELGCGAHVSSLRRTASGSMLIEHAHSLEEILEVSNTPAGISSLTINTLDLFPGTHIFSADAPIMQGKFLPITDTSAAENLIPIVSYDERLLALYTQKDQLLKPDTVFSGGIYPPNIGPCVATIGTFDGVHRGHIELLDQTVSEARKRNLPSVAITFDPLPQSQLREEESVEQLSSLQDRVQKIKSRGVDRIVIMSFTPEVGALSPERFVREMLYARCVPQTIFVGENFRFGAKACAGPRELRDIMSIAETNVVEVELVCVSDLTVSSTRVRNALLSHDLETAQKLLGRRVSFSGFVTSGAGLGTGLGFPTANLIDLTPPKLPIGIYAGHVRIETANGTSQEMLEPAALFIGSPRDIRNEPTVEVHLLDTEKNLLGKRLFIEVDSYIGAPAQYETPDALKAGIAEAINKVRQVLNLPFSEV